MTIIVRNKRKVDLKYAPVKKYEHSGSPKQTQYYDDPNAPDESKGYLFCTDINTKGNNND